MKQQRGKAKRRKVVSPGHALYQRTCLYLTAYQIRHFFTFTHHPDPPLMFSISVVNASNPLDVQTRNLRFILYSSITLRIYIQLICKVCYHYWDYIAFPFFFFFAWITDNFSSLTCMPLDLFHPQILQIHPLFKKLSPRDLCKTPNWLYHILT